MSNEFLKRLLVFEEGYNPTVHVVDGKRHIGIGHNLEIDQTQEELDVMGIVSLGEITDGFTLTEEQAHALFELDVEDALEDVQPAFVPDELEALGEIRRAVIISMCFQMGGAGVRKFKNFRNAVKQGDFDTAAQEMLYADPDTGRRSQWYLQTPDRCQRAADAMVSNTFPALEPDVDSIVGDPPEETAPDSDGYASYSVPELVAVLLQIAEELDKRVQDNYQDVPF